MFYQFKTSQFIES